MERFALVHICRSLTASVGKCVLVVTWDNFWYVFQTEGSSSFISSAEVLLYPKECFKLLARQHLLLWNSSQPYGSFWILGAVLLLGKLQQVQQRPRRWSEPVDWSVQVEAFKAGLLQSGKQRAKRDLILSSAIFWGVTTDLSCSYRSKVKG